MKKINPILATLLVLVSILVKKVLSLRYKVNLKGTEHLQSNSPLLILPNHPALIDPVILISHIYKNTQAIPVITSSFYDLPVLKTIFSSVGAVRVSDLNAGSRNVNVLNDITRAVLKGFNRNKNIVLYPAGQLSNQGQEKIFNKKSAQKIVIKIPDHVKVIGVRTTGLWGSMWSKAETGKSPDFMIQLLKGMAYLLLNLIFFMPRRKVTIEFEDLSPTAKEKAQLDKKDFNLFLEDFYNLHGKEKLNLVSYFWYERQKYQP